MQGKHQRVEKINSESVKQANLWRLQCSSHCDRINGEIYTDSYDFLRKKKKNQKDTSSVDYECAQQISWQACKMRPCVKAKFWSKGGPTCPNSLVFILNSSIIYSKFDAKQPYICYLPGIESSELGLLWIEFLWGAKSFVIL